MKAVVTVIGKDKVGIIAKVSAACAEFDANILDISQTVLREYFSMIMILDIGDVGVNFGAFSDSLAKLGEQEGVDIRVMHEDIFHSMHEV